MKYIIVFAGVLALLAITQAQDDTTSAEVLEPNSSSPIEPSDQRPPRPGKPGRPGHPGHHHDKPQPSDNGSQESDSVNSEGNPAPHREQVLLNVNFGKRNTIIENQQDITTTTAAPAG